MKGRARAEGRLIETRPNDLPGALRCGALVIFFSLLLLWRDPSVFWNDDYQVSILPVFADVARSWSEGHWPLLSPYSWVCSNLAGEFQYGTFSIFINAAVILIWKLPLSFAQQAAALSISHLFVLAMGGYFLARGRKLEPPLATMVGLIAALNGWIICWGATDWFGALGAFAWLPWSWWGLERALERDRGPTRFLWPVPFIYLLIAGGFPYTVVMVALLVAWLSLKSITQTRSLISIWPMALAMLLGVGLSAPAWLALFDYLSGSARQAQESAAHFQWIVPPASLPGFFLPAWTVNWADFLTRMRPHGATEMACGMVAPSALLFALLIRPKLLLRKIRWELGLLVIVLVVSMLPTANVFRWSFRWLPFLHLILALCAAEALRVFALEQRKVACAALAALGVMGLALWLLGTAGPYGWRLLVVMLALGVIWVFWQGKWMPAIVTFLSLLATYLCIPPNCGVPRYNLDPALTSAAPLDPERLYLSVYPEVESAYRAEKRPQPFGTVVRVGSTSMWGGVRLLNGYSPIRPAGVAREFEVAIHGELAPWAREFYPVFEAGSGGLLAKIGVDGIIVASELEVVPKPEDEWELVHSSEEGRVYHRRGAALPRIRSDAAIVRVLEDSRQRAVAEVEVPGGNGAAQVTFSRPYFRGYQARLGDPPLEVHSIKDMYPIVDLPAGASGRLVLEYRPRWLVYGSVVAAVCGLFSLGTLIWGKRLPRVDRLSAGNL